MNPFPFKAISLNARGFEKNADAFFNLIRKSYDFGFFQETLISDKKSISSLSSRWGGKSFWSPAIGKQGGFLVLINDRFDCEVLSWKRDSSARLVSLLIAVDRSKFNLVCVYAPTNLTERREFFSELHEFFIPAEGLVLGGDFNCYDSTLDKLNGNVNINNEFKDLKSTFHLVDVWRKSHPGVREFTWFNSDYSIASRLDKFYLSSNIANLFLSSSIIPCCYSDHDYVDLHLDFSLFPPGDLAFGNLITLSWMIVIFAIISVPVSLIFPLVFLVFSLFRFGGIFLKSLSRVIACHLLRISALNYRVRRLF